MRSLSWLLCLGLCGCGTTAVQFHYSVLQKDAAGNLTVPLNCEDSGIFAIRLIMGNDLDQNGSLSDDEILEDATRDCNQRDDNADGVLSADELGLFTVASFDPGAYDLFAIELFGQEAEPIRFQTFDSASDAVRFSFGGGVRLKRGVDNLIKFGGDAQQLSDEIQLFVP